MKVERKGNFGVLIPNIGAFTCKTEDLLQKNTAQGAKVEPSGGKKPVLIALILYWNLLLAIFTSLLANFRFYWRKNLFIGEFTLLIGEN